MTAAYRHLLTAVMVIGLGVGPLFAQEVDVVEVLADSVVVNGSLAVADTATVTTTSSGQRPLLLQGEVGHVTMGGGLRFAAPEGGTTPDWIIDNLDTGLHFTASGTGQAEMTLDGFGGLAIAGSISIAGGPAIAEVSDDPTLADASATTLPTEAAVKAYVDGEIAALPAPPTVLDEDDMASNSATAVPSQQSVKAYVGDEIAALPTPPTVLDEDDMASDSATSVPSQQSVKAYVEGALGGGPALLATFEPDDWPEISMAGVFDSQYTIYRIVGWVRPVMNRKELRGQLGTVNGTAWDDSSSSYRWLGMQRDNDGDGHSGDQSSDSKIDFLHDLGGDQVKAPSNASHAISFIDMKVIAPGDPSVTTIIHFEGSYIDAGNDIVRVYGAARSNEAAKAHDSIRLYFETGNVAAGSLKVYGIQ